MVGNKMFVIRWFYSKNDSKDTKTCVIYIYIEFLYSKLALKAMDEIVSLSLYTLDGSTWFNPPRVDFLKIV